jgi:Ribosome-associated heat shock protein implicated in the recycling of the 50S subunit (S4 paralog)
LERHRLDLWLKLACVFKHRTDATEACRGGHVKANGVRAKPAAAIQEGDVIEITDDDFYRKLVVLGLPEHSISKDTARTMYREETPERPKKAERPAVGERDRGMGRPTKKERRELEKYWSK